MFIKSDCSNVSRVGDPVPKGPSSLFIFVFHKYFVVRLLAVLSIISDKHIAKNVQSTAEVTFFFFFKTEHLNDTPQNQSPAKLLENSTASMQGTDNLGLLSCLGIPAKAHN